MILVYFASGGCADQIVKNQKNNQFTSVIVVHFMNSARPLGYQKKTVFNVYFCLNHSWIYEHNQFEMRDAKLTHQRQFLRNLDNFYIQAFTCSFY